VALLSVYAAAGRQTSTKAPDGIHLGVDFIGVHKLGLHLRCAFRWDEAEFIRCRTRGRLEQIIRELPGIRPGAAYPMEDTKPIPVSVV